MDVIFLEEKTTVKFDQIKATQRICGNFGIEMQAPLKRAEAWRERERASVGIRMLLPYGCSCLSCWRRTGACLMVLRQVFAALQNYCDIFSFYLGKKSSSSLTHNFTAPGGNL